MNKAIGFLGRFVLASALGMVFLAPLSRVYFRLMSLEANVIFAAISHPVHLSFDVEDGTYLVYPSIRPIPTQPSKILRIQFLDGSAVNYSLLVVLALFLATPGLSWQEKASGVVMSLLILSLAHIVYVYGTSQVLVWDSQPHLAGGIPTPGNPVLAALERDFPRGRYRLWSALMVYATHAVREILPFILWAAFSRKALNLVR